MGHSCDANGNELSVNGQAASYDFENHLVGLSGGTSYTYDADGNRVGATAGGATTSYLVDASLPYASVVEEYSGSTLAARYDYGDDLVRMDRASGVYYYLYDGLGSTRQLVGTGGAVTDGYSYDAFGEGLSHGPNSGVVNPFLFNAQQYDAASGDYYLRARYYDPSNGRFLSQDPFVGRNEHPVTLHRYLYANDDPVGCLDPSGRSTEGLTGSLASLTGFAALAASVLVINNAAHYFQHNRLSLDIFTSPAPSAPENTPDPAPRPNPGGSIDPVPPGLSPQDDENNNRVALSLAGPMEVRIRTFADMVDGRIWYTYHGREGFGATTADFLYTANDERNQIHFNMDGFDEDIDPVIAIRKAANNPYRSRTNWELQQIRNNSFWWPRIIWWLNGIPGQPNPFEHN